MIAGVAVKSCCADLYASDWARLVLGESLHPGGAPLTKRLGQLMKLGPGMRVLDVAAGRGFSALHVAREFGCRVLGIDYGAVNVAAAALEARAAGLDGRVAFAGGDAERLPCADGRFDAVMCECAFCTFPDKTAAAAELARVLRPGAVLGLADLVRRGRLPRDMDDLLAWIACIADARPPAEYAGQLTVAGFEVTALEDHDQALADLVGDMRLRLMGAQVAAHLSGVELPGAELARARELARAAERAIADGSLGYVLIVARKPY
ncbi:MAG: methyltransferase type 11 [Candidatus Nephthysia bennettiae]|uniref:Methyltransferase domain-containing protein n=1 Tax=Candidatus Nephthysia bennettiae TaxID=3127016 RepID=A0A934N5F9_9BACT|nr:methyltransferase domain-containing protein [Candidatus Dormibacteraeota bacterium]MBJ7611377.1 methyltransferase domain-containing protein [Candidatus Dormibacteraeota bacterium]PZR91847.1 MAG: methyltransferase type 11 [Candidatus Dormibacteraeota bacterium]